jgi:AbrB family looped-hinge helix DNA binding protein
MRIKVSTKGQTVLPGPLRRGPGIRVGDPLDVNVEEGRIILTPHEKSPHRVRTLIDPVTGLPVLSAGVGTPPLRSEDVEKILANFP